MNFLSRDALRTLAGRPEGPCVSLYLPTSGDAPLPAASRFRNLLRSAEGSLRALGLRSAEANRLLEPGHDLVFDSSFWRAQSDGLAVFANHGAFLYFQLPVRFAEESYVNGRFHIKPLFPLLAGDGRFYVLGFTPFGARLFEGTRSRVTAMEAKDLPRSLVRSLNGPRAGGAFVRSGLLEWFRQLNAGVRDLLANEPAPLVIAGEENYFFFYRSVNTHPRLVGTGLPGPIDSPGLHERAWELVAPQLASSRQKAAEVYVKLKGTGYVSSDLNEILPAAHQGRVASLFFPESLRRWGTFDPRRNALEVHAEEAPGDEDLLDVAASRTLLSNGTVYAVPPDAVPDGAPVAAIFRQ